MELRHLRYFVTVAELLNFTKAAGKLRVAQPALSRQIRDLEEELGVPLLERNSRSVRLTAAGGAFMAEARAVLERVEAAIQTARAFATGERGELRLGYAPSPTVELLSQALQAFQKECPKVRVTLHDLTVQAMLQGLREDALDAALTVASPVKELRGLAFHKLRTYAMQVAVGRDHKLARRKVVSVTQLKAEQLVAYGLEGYPEYHEWLGRYFAPVGGPPAIAEEHDSATSLIAAVEAGRGVALVPSVLSSLAGPRLVLRAVEPSPEPLVVGVAYSRAHLNPATKRFVNAVRAMCAREGQAAAT